MMSLLPYFAIPITLGSGYFIVKRHQTHMVLLLSGLLMVSLAILAGQTAILPKGMKTSGFVGFDILDLLVSIATRQSSGVGFLIMVAGGFATYMDRIGAANALVRLSAKPLQAVHQPYLVLALAYLLGQALVTVVPSAAGLAMLLLVVLLPMLTGVGVSAAAAVAVIGTTAGMTLGPASGTGLLAAKVAKLEPIVYFVKCQLPVALPTLLAVALTHFFVQRHYDRKSDDAYETPKDIKGKDALVDAPGWYALFPIIPVVLLIVFSKLVYTPVKLDTISALFLTWLGAVLVEFVRCRSSAKVFGDAMVMFKSMGNMFATIVSLIIAAEMFAAGLKVTGLIDLLLSSGQHLGMGMSAMTVVLTGIVGLVTFLTGSGVGAYSSFATLAPDVAAGLGGSVEALVTPMQFVSGMARGMSPVAGVIIAVAGAVGINPLAVVRRTWLPMSIGIVVMLASSMLLLG